MTRRQPFAQLEALITEIPDHVVRMDALACLADIEAVINDAHAVRAAHSHLTIRCDKCGIISDDEPLHYWFRNGLWTCTICGAAE